MTVSEPPDDQARTTMRRLLYGQLLTQALCAAAALRLADLLAAGPLDAETLTERAGTHLPSLRRLLNALAAFGVVQPCQDGTYALTPLGDTLRSDHPGSLLPTALLIGAEFGQAWNAMVTTIETGRPAFREVFGTDVFTYLRDNPSLRKIFDRSQVAGLTADAQALVRFLSATEIQAPSIADIGGGRGDLLAYLLAHHPRGTGILLERHEMLPIARAALTQNATAARCTLQAGDFFQHIPPGADLYILREVLHDWDDERCTLLLRSCRRAIPESGHLAILETLAPESSMAGIPPTDALAVLSDLYMLTVPGGQERSQSQYAALLTAGGFRLETIERLPSGHAFLHASPADLHP